MRLRTEYVFTSCLRQERFVRLWYARSSLRWRIADANLSDRHRKMIDEAEKSCGRLVALIAELSEIGKLDSGAITLGHQPIDFFGLVAEVAEHMHEAEDRGVHLIAKGE